MSEAALRRIGHPRAGALRLASDARLVRIAVRGEQRAFAAIFQRYHQELYRYCRAILGDDEEAGDALQNTMLKVMRALPGESREIALRPWLYRIAHNEAIALLRQRQPSAELSEEIANLTDAPPEHRVQQRERLRHLVADLRSLPDRQRGALVMRELNGVDYSAIGAAFGTSSAVARQTVYEARVALQEMAEGREMTCESIRQALSDGDGRVLRGRKLRAHLRDCEGCRDFRAGIRQRRSDLAALAPPLPALAAAGLLQSILGFSQAGAGTGGLLGSLGGTGKILASSGALKSVAAVAATATIAVGAADVTGVIHPPLIGRSSSTSATTQSPASTASPASSGAQGASGSGSSQAGEGSKAKDGHRSEAAANSHRHSNAGHGHSKSALAPGHAGTSPSGTRGNSAFGKSHAPQSLPKAAKSHAPVAGGKAKASHPSHPGHPSHPSSPPKSAGSTSNSHPAPATAPGPPADGGNPNGP
jgi:RNA polymerase sigma factor (sigma-70 family)